MPAQKIRFFSAVSLAALLSQGVATVDAAFAESSQGGGLCLESIGHEAGHVSGESGERAAPQASGERDESESLAAGLSAESGSTCAGGIPAPSSLVAGSGGSGLALPGAGGEVLAAPGFGLPAVGGSAGALFRPFAFGDDVTGAVSLTISADRDQDWSGSSSSDSLTISGSGTEMSGNINFLGGHDFMTSAQGTSITGNIDAGSGNDQFILSGSFSGNLLASATDTGTTNFELRSSYVASNVKGITPGGKNIDVIVSGVVPSGTQNPATITLPDATGINGASQSWELYVCNELANTSRNDCGSDLSSANNYGINVVLDFTNDSGNFDEIRIRSHDSGGRSSLTFKSGLNVNLESNLYDIDILADGSAGDTITFGAAVSVEAFSSSGSGSSLTKGGALVELDLNPAGGGATTADSVVFAAEATGHSSSATTLAVAIKAPQNALAAEGTSVKIADLHSSAVIRSLTLWDFTTHATTTTFDHANQTWTLAAGDAGDDGYTSWNLTAGAPPAEAVSFGVTSDSPSDRTIGSANAFRAVNVTITSSDSSGTWSGTFTSPATGDYDDTITIASGVTSSGALDLGGGDNTITRATTGIGDATFSGSVTLGGGGDTIGGATATVAASMLAMTGGVNLGGGTNVMRVSSAGGANLTGNAITGGAGSDTVEVSGAVTGNVDLGADTNTLSVTTLSGSYTGLGGADTITLGTGTSAGDTGATWNLGDGGNAIKTATDLASGTATISAAVTLGAGNDTIGGLLESEYTSSTTEPQKTNAANESRLAMGAVTLGDGTNKMRVASASSITGGTGADSIEVAGAVTSDINLGGGAGNNYLAVGGAIGGLVSSTTTGTDEVSIGGGTGNVNLGNGTNTLTIATGTWTGTYTAGTDADTIVVASEATLGASSSPADLSLGAGADVVMGAGTITSAIALGDGDDRIGIDPGGPDGDLTTTAGNPSPEEVTAANTLALPGGVNLGDGANKMWAASVGDPDASPLVTVITGGGGDDTVSVSGTIAGDVTLGAGANTLTAGSLTGNYTGGAGNDTVTLKPATDITLGTLDFGAGTNKLFIVGTQDNPATRKVTLDLSGPATGTDELHICNQSSTASACSALTGARGQYAFNVVLNATGAGKANSWESVNVSNKTSDVRSLLQVGADITLKTAELGRITIQSDGAVGDAITLDGAITIGNYEPATTGPNASPASGTLFELDFDSSAAAAANSADKLVFNAAATSSDTNPTTMASVQIKPLDASAFAAEGAKVTIAEIHDTSTIDSIQIWDATRDTPAHVTTGSSITLAGGQAWTLGREDGSAADVMRWYLEAGSVPFQTESITSGDRNVTSTQNPAVAIHATISGGGATGTWSGTFTSATGDHGDVITIDPGMTAEGNWTLYAGNNTIKRAVQDPNSLGNATISGTVTMLGGNDTIGGLLASEYDDNTSQAQKDTAAAESMLAMGVVSLGDGTNKMRVASASSITGGAGADSIEVAGEVTGAINLGGGAGDNYLAVGGAIGGLVSSATTGTDTVSIGGGAGNVNLGDGANSLTVSAGRWTGTYTAGAGVDTIIVASGAIIGAINNPATLSLGTGVDALRGEGTITSAVALGAGDDTIGIDPGGLDGNLTTTDDNPSGAAIAAANALALPGGVDLGEGVNKMWAASVGDPDASSPGRVITGGSGNDTVVVSGAVTGNVNLGGGANALIAESLEGTYSGGDGNDTITLTPVAPASGNRIIILELDLGGGDNDMFLVGGTGDPTLRKVSLVGGRSSGSGTDTLHICSEGAGDSGCETGGAGDHAFDVVLNSSVASIWETINVSNEDSAQRSFLLGNGSLSFVTAKLNNLSFTSDRSAGDVFTFMGGAGASEGIAIKAYSVDANDVQTGTLFELDLDPAANSGAGGADRLVFTQNAKNISTESGLSDTAFIRVVGIPGASLEGSKVTIASLHSGSNISGISILGADTSGSDPVIDLHSQPWTLGSQADSDNNAITLWTLTAGPVPFENVIVRSVTDDITRTAQHTAGFSATFASSVTEWRGSITVLATDTHNDRVLLSGGMRSTGTWNLGGGSNIIANAGGGTGGVATVSGRVTLGAGADTIGGDNLLDSESALAMTGGVALGDGTNVMRVQRAGRAGLSVPAISGGSGNDTVEVVGDVIGAVNLGGGENSLSALSLAGGYTGGSLRDEVGIFGAISGNVNLGDGENTLSVGSLTGNYMGGSGNDTIALISPAANFTTGALNPGGGRNRLFVIGGEGSAASKRATLDLGGGPATGADNDTVWICSEAAGDSGCETEATGDYAFNVALNASGASGITWETIHIHNEDSDERSLLQVGTDISFETAKLNRLTVESNGAAGDVITFAGEIAVQAYDASTGSGTLFELDVNPSASNSSDGADVLVFTAGATRISGTANPADMAYVQIEAAVGVSAKDGVVTVARIHDSSYIDGIILLGADTTGANPVITLNSQPWTLGSSRDSTTSVTAWTLTAGAVPFDAVPVASAGQNIDRTTQQHAAGFSATFDSAVTNWFGTITVPAEDTYKDIVTLSAGMTASGTWNLGGGNNEIRRVAGAGDGATISGEVTLGKGADTIGGAAASDPESMLAMSGGVTLGDGANEMRVSSAGRAGLSRDAITGGMHADTIEVSGAVMGNVDLKAGENSFMAGSLSGDYTGGGDADTVTVNGAIIGSVNLGGGGNSLTAQSLSAGYEGGDAGDTIMISGAIGGNVDLGDGLNSLTAASLGGNYMGGSGNDTIRLQPASSFTTGTLNPGEGTNRLFVIGSVESVADKRATLDLGGGPSTGANSDTVWICSEGAGSSGCSTQATGNYTFNVAINASGASGVTWETIHIHNEDSDERSLLQVGTDISFETAKLNRLTVESNGAAGDVITFAGEIAVQAYDASTGSGTLFELDVNPSASNSSDGADVLVFTAGATGISGTADPTDMAYVQIEAAAGVSAKDGVVTVARIHDSSSIDGIILLGADTTGANPVITLNSQPWTLGSSRDSTTSVTSWTLTAGAVPFDAVPVASAGQNIDRTEEPHAAGFSATFDSAVTNWSGTITVPANDEYKDIVTLSAGMAASGAWNLGGGNNEIRRVAGAGEAATISGEVTLGAGADMIGGAAASDPESMLAMSGGVTLGDGANEMRVSSAGRAGLSRDAITGGAHADTIEVSGAVMGNVDLKAGENSFMAESLSGDYTGGVDADTVMVNGVVMGRVNLGGGRNSLTAQSLSAGYEGGDADDTIEISGAIGGNVDLGDGLNTLTAASLGGNYMGGSGNDTIRLQPASSFTTGTLNPGEGTNRLFVIGSVESLADKRATLDLGGGPSTGANSDTVWICSEGAGASGCSTQATGNYAFNVSLNASGASGVTWETIHIHNEDSAERSRLRVGTDISFETAKLNRLTVESNGAAGDVITFAGEIAVQAYDSSTGSGTLFELDVSPSASDSPEGADVLVFTAGATRISGTTSPADMAYVQIEAAAGFSAEGGIVTIARVHDSSSIDGIILLGADTTGANPVITLNSQPWTFGSSRDSNTSETAWTLTAGTVPLSVTWTDAVSAASGVFSQISGVTIPVQSSGANAEVSQGAATRRPPFLWTSFKSGSEEQTLSEKRKEKYDNSFQLFTAGFGFYDQDTGDRVVSNFISLTYGTVDSDSDLESTVTGVGYGARFAWSSGMHFNLSGALATSTSEKTARGITEEFKTKGQVFNMEIGKSSRLSDGMDMTLSSGLTESWADDVTLKNGDSLTGFNKTELDVSAKISRDGASEGGADLFGAAKVAHDLSSEFNFKRSGENPVAIDAAKTWFHVSGGMAWESGNSRFYLEGSLDQSIAGADASRQSVTLGYDLSW